jgi:Rha family phage regulatory protein
MTTLVAQNFDSFVFAQNDEIKTTSLLVAEKFGKLHKDVLKKIESLECSAEFIGRNFALIETDVKVGFGTRKSPAYEMTKDGFMFLVMGFTGKAAAEVKELYINAFNFMLAKLKPVPNALRDLPPQTLTPAMLRHIEKRISWLNKNQVGSTYAGLGRMIKEKFNVNERKAIHVSKYPEICALLGCEPDPKALQGELLEPAKIATPEFNPTSPTFTLENITNQTVITQQHNGLTVSYIAEKGTLIGTVENIIRDLKVLGYHVVKNEKDALETISRIANSGFVA